MSSVPRSSDRNEDEASRKQGKKHKGHSTTDPRSSEASSQYQAISYADGSRDPVSPEAHSFQGHYGLDPYSSARTIPEESYGSPPSYTFSPSGYSTYEVPQWQYDTPQQTGSYYAYGYGSTTYDNPAPSGATYSKKGTTREPSKDYPSSALTAIYPATNQYVTTTQPQSIGQEQTYDPRERKGKGKDASSSGNLSTQNPAVSPAGTPVPYGRHDDQTQLSDQYDRMSLSHAGSHGQREALSQGSQMQGHAFQTINYTVPGSTSTVHQPAHDPGSQQHPTVPFSMPPDIEVSLQYKGGHKWHDTKGMWDTGNTFASLVLRDLILDLGYRSDDIDFSKGSEFKVVGGAAVKTFGVVKLHCSLNSGPMSVEYFQVLDFVIEGYDVIISPPESRKSSSKKSTPVVAASIQPRRNLTKEELKEMKKSFERAERNRDETKERWEKEHKRKKRPDDKKKSEDKKSEGRKKSEDRKSSTK
ncbi:uncharacterized protein E0L32_005129 [Thyridium curvatum]|uniref:Uncharacterized protein n=1 Tax=Thyridium curvatum TaxID=1093900 RepID=A0A507B802_9PEZI|nr:uncharacterized protein E0L32_005129 [Thyridium curvatum]TPX14734.1 hypothetical protein E0L32_005129 [Thyridium curvatum]